MTMLIRWELCSAESNKYINSTGIINSGIFFDCDPRIYKRERFVISMMTCRPANMKHIVPLNMILTVQAMSVEELVGDNFLSDVCAIDIRNHPLPLGGFNNSGSPIVVEIDESYFYHRKYHHGRVNIGEWVFGAVEREQPLQDAGGAGPEGCHHPAHNPAVMME